MQNPTRRGPPGRGETKMDLHDPDPHEPSPAGRFVEDSLTLGVRWVDGKGTLRTTLLRVGRQLRYVAHLVRLLDGEAPPYPEPALEWRAAKDHHGNEPTRFRHLYVHWSDGDQSYFPAGSDPLEYVLRLREILAMPERERWLHLSPEASLSVRGGLGQSARGEARSLGSFARHAEGEG